MQLKIGTRVRTAKPLVETTGWSAEALRQRRWGVVGKILQQNTGHGLCFEVQHPDGTSGWYEPSELVDPTETLWERLGGDL